MPQQNQPTTLPPSDVGQVQAREVDDETWINDRMLKMADSDGTPEELAEILLEGMTPTEQRAFCLGVRAGKHNAASVFLTSSGRIVKEIAKEIDPYMR